MAETDTFRNRQEGELQVILSIFGEDAEDLRPSGPWKPLNLKIRLEPLKSSSGGGNTYVNATLHVICPVKYPKFVPKISIENTKGLSVQQIEELTQMLQKQGNEMKGEEMIYQLSGTVQEFLHTHNKPPALSFYDEMIQDQTKRFAQNQLNQRQTLTVEQQQLREDVLRRKEMFRNEPKRREVRRSISEASPIHRSNSSSDTSESSVFRWPLANSNNCEDCRKIQRGCCLGHSNRGCVAFSGIDLETGQLLYITEWNIRYAQLESKCIFNCARTSVDGKCSGHTTDEILHHIDRQTAKLSQLRHKHVVNYECVQYHKKKDGVVLYMGQEFVLGTSVSSITGSMGWCIEGISMVARGILESLFFLHNQGISHNNLNESTVFMDNSGTTRITDFSLIPMIMELVSTAEESDSRIVENDLPALGSLIESMSPTVHHDNMADFLERCKSMRTISASDLLEHPFLRAVGLNSASTILLTRTANTINERQPVRANQRQIETSVPAAINNSRLSTEFEKLQWLGKGAFGDVLKVRNILDNREYAIKRIPLTPETRIYLQRKMTREVELLSRLNHENVVRYYNSWLESASLADDCRIGDTDEDGSSINQPSVKAIMPRIIHDESSSSSDSHWMDQQDLGDFSSDGIEFQNSDGGVIEQSDHEQWSKSTTVSTRKSPRPEPQIMYIQMEFCEKSTLRTAIDDGLFSDHDRLWRLFREIAEGLSHIHQQGIIHRDLKPVNIFLDSRDQVKIGDFGLATTSFLALQNQERTNQADVSKNGDGDLGLQSRDICNSLTGKVGTALYIAPELMENASRSTYNQKVDLYSLGIIFFEMSHKPFDTAMERHQVITALRSPRVVIPEYMSKNPNSKQQVSVMQWLLDHDISIRPTAEMLLASDMLPPAQLEASELQEMLRHALANPQSKAYKHLVARCLAQKSDKVLELTYHLGLSATNDSLETVKTHIIAMFRKHGAEDFCTPLLWPALQPTYPQSSVRLMTHSGSVVELPHDLRIPFIKTIALSPKDRVRRFSIGRAYREKKVFYFHPKEMNECTFDIITPHRGCLLADAECMAMASEITAECTSLNTKNISFRLNHTSLLRSILLHCNVPVDKYDIVFAAIQDLIEGRGTKFHFNSTLSNIMTTRHTVTQLTDLLMVEYPLGGSRGSVSGSILRTLLKGRNDVSMLAKTAIKELEAVVGMAQVMGVTCTMNAFAGLPFGYDRCTSGGIVWQLVAKLKTGEKAKQIILAHGGRYDGMLAEYQIKAHDCGLTVPNKPKFGVGFTFMLDKVMSTLNYNIANDIRTMDACVLMVPGSSTRDVSQVLRSLWAAGIRTGIVEDENIDDAQEVARNLNASHLVMFDHAGVLCIRSWDRQNQFRDHFVNNRQELVDRILKKLPPNGTSQNGVNSSEQSSMLNSSMNKGSTAICDSGASYRVDFLTPVRQTVHARRRIETQMQQHMDMTLKKLCSKEYVYIIVVDLKAQVLRELAVAFDLRSSETQNQDEIDLLLDRHPRCRDYIQQIANTIMKSITSDKKTQNIIALYSQIDASYRLIV